MTQLDDNELRDIYTGTKTIAVVGASSNQEKPAYLVPRFLQRRGYRLVPVTPSSDEVLGEPAVPTLAEVTDPIDVVDVFRPAEEAPDIARAAVEIKAKVLWLQEGIVSEEAAAIARDGGLTVVMDACIKQTYVRLGIGAEA